MAGLVGPSRVDSALFSEWRAQSLALLVGALGEGHIYAQRFAGDVTEAHYVDGKRGVGVLRAVLDDARHGHLTDLRLLLAAEVFADLIEMARHLLDAGYHLPAASLAGAVLEDGLRRIAARRGVRVRSRDDASSLNARLADGGAYSRLDQKRLQVAIQVRNHADHGEFNLIAREDVAGQMDAIETFLAAQLGEGT
jgi:hypothetical protein